MRLGWSTGKPRTHSGFRWHSLSKSLGSSVANIGRLHAQTTLVLIGKILEVDVQIVNGVVAHEIDMQRDLSSYGCGKSESYRRMKCVFCKDSNWTQRVARRIHLQ